MRDRRAVAQSQQISKVRCRQGHLHMAKHLPRQPRNPLSWTSVFSSMPPTTIGIRKGG